MVYSIALISPPSIRQVVELYLPTNLLALAGSLKANGIHYGVIDMNTYAAQDLAEFFTDPIHHCLDILDKHADAYDAFGMTTLSTTYPLIFLLAKAMKQRYDKPIILGGPQATMVAKETLEVCPSIDYIVLHEGEQTLVELLSNDLSTDIPGIAYRDTWRIIATESRSLIEDLDALAMPDYEAISIDDYTSLSRQLVVPLDIGRGCPFKCTFCATAPMWHRQWRMKSPARVAREMDALNTSYGLSHFFLTHDNFTTIKEYVISFCTEIANKGYQWTCFSRCDTIDGEMISAMKAAGCIDILFGVESASQKTLMDIHKGINLADYHRAKKLCRENDIDFSSAYILGFPEESSTELECTLRASIIDSVHNPKKVFINILEPLPGTEITVTHMDRLSSPLVYQSDPPLYLNKHSSLVHDATALIQEHPTLFSSFYFIRPTHITLDRIFRVYDIIHTLTEHYPYTAHLLMTLGHVKPLTLIEEHPHVVSNSDSMELLLMSSIAKSFDDRRQFKDIVEDVLKYEHTLHKLHALETPVVAIESQRMGEQGMPVHLHGYIVSLSPNAIPISLRYDIESVFESIRNEDLIGQPEISVTNYMMYENGLNNELSILQIDDASSTLISLAQRNSSLVSFLGKIKEHRNADALQELFETLWRDGLLIVQRAEPSK